ncbi:Chloride transport protein 6 [Gracilariopsis chorda]|uniref:Chloride channel protein n=1 Tax=Gracilariopsis chorda TaxID=448386 RepID=A0A2V3J1J4_9FLOR|nr:Chloride transport protein 6 [Gracilariopsis chorda]|eukprot:PXF48258.1 Chloride transport protein 6 [Gracilariopsis chorda]
MAQAPESGIYSLSYAAFFAPRTHKFETVDFRLPASPANVASYFPTSSKQRTLQLRLAGLLGISVGIVFAVVGFVVDQLTKGLTIGLYTATERVFNVANFWLAVLVHVALSVLFVLIASLMVVYVAPLGAGSGIPELKSYLNGVRVPGFLAMNSFFVKAIGIAFSISGGLICGKQGPMIHAGAILGAGMSQAASSRCSWRLNSSLFRIFRTESWKRDFAAVGAAVGVAVAFGSPMGAWMWVYEEACTHWNWDLGIITLGGCLVGSAVVRVLNYLASGLPGSGFTDFTLNEIGKLAPFLEGSTFQLKDFPVYVTIGIIGGVVGAILPIINKYITLFRYSRVTQPTRRLIESGFIALLTALLRIVIPYIANDCQDVDPELQGVLDSAPFSDFSRFHCEEGQYSPWASLMYNPSDSVVRAVMFTPGSGHFPAAAVATAVAFYFVFIIWTYGVAVPAGVFFPGVLLGSVYGRLVAIAVKAIFPTRTDLSSRGIAFVGAVSALAGFTRTISVSVIALEAVGGYNGAYAAVLVAIIAKLTADFLYSQGIYDLHIALKGIPFLSSGVPDLESYLQLRLSDVMQSKVIGVRRYARISGLLRMLATNQHHSFPVFLKLIPTTSSSSRDFAAAAQSSNGVGIRPPRGLSSSTDSLITSQLELMEAHNIKKLVPVTTIITPDHAGLQATIFDEGTTRLVTLTDQKEVLDYRTYDHRDRSSRGSGIQDVQDSSRREDPSSGDASAQSLRKSSVNTSSNAAPQFELVGVIDRVTLIALLKHECENHERETSGNDDIEDRVTREELDSAWPNSSLMKNDGENVIIDRVRRLNVLDRVIDLKQHINPDPLLMSDRALPSTAYSLFRRTGARHILVANMRSGRVCGVITRKDILPESVQEALNRIHGVKVS